jgi:hypothetical protein
MMKAFLFTGMAYPALARSMLRGVVLTWQPRRCRLT